MGDLTISTGQILAVVAGAAGLVTSIWHAAIAIGRLTVKVERHGDRLDKHEGKLSDHDGELKFLKGIGRG